MDVPDSSFLSILDMVALNLKLNKTVISQAGTICTYAYLVRYHAACYDNPLYNRDKGKESVAWQW